MKLKLTHEQQAQTVVVRKLAPLADLYICDAFAAAHRDQPSLCGFEQVLPSAMGRLFEKEYCVISELMESLLASVHVRTRRREDFRCLPDA
ncbi:MAG: phosphoglycerate kinase [Oscillospiraceae bacterium]